MATSVEQPSLVAQKSTTGRTHYSELARWYRRGFAVTARVAPPLATAWAQRLFFTPPRIRVRDEERAVLARGERFAVDVEGRRVVGYTWGEGPTVLLVHGWGGHAGHMTPLVDPLVAQGLRAVAIDMPAHGESEGRRSSIVHFAAAVARVAALFKPLRGLVAHSLGAAACTYALSRGVAAERAVFFAPPASLEPFWARFRAGMGMDAEAWERVVRASESWLKVPFTELHPIDLAPSMTTPLLVLHDASDREVLFSEGAALASRWPNATLQRAEQLGHVRILRDPERVAEAVRFVRG